MGQPGCEHRVQLAAELGAALCRGSPGSWWGRAWTLHSVPGSTLMPSKPPHRPSLTFVFVL